MIVPVIATLGTWEALWWAVRRHRRSSAYARALSRARALRRPLAVIGAPDGGVTGGYGCGGHHDRPCAVPVLPQRRAG